MSKQKIRFVDSLNNTLFYIDGGDDIEIETTNGWQRFTCHYVDDFHFKLNNHTFHIIEFAEIRERFIQRYRPAIMENKPERRIRFVTTSGETFFYLDDGEEIELEVGNEWIRYTCRYMDDYHFKLGDYIYHIGQFAQEKEKLVQRYRPVNPIKEEKTLCKKQPAKRSGN